MALDPRQEFEHARLSAKIDRVGIVGVLILVLVTAVYYATSLKMGFDIVDDYAYLYSVGSSTPQDYLAQVFNPGAQGANYRPIKRVLNLVEYALFGADAGPYHAVQVLMHTWNVLLVYVIVANISNRRRLAFLSAFFYAGFPVASGAVLWITDEIVLATLFSLISVLAWVRYLKAKSRWMYGVAILSLALALLTKESSIVVPPALFFVDRLLIRDRATLSQLVRRYSAVAAITAAFLMLVYLVHRQSLFLTLGAYSLGQHVFTSLSLYLALLASPWGLRLASTVTAVAWEGIAAVVFVTMVARNRPWAFLFLMILGGIGPVALSPFWIVPRYLYMSAIPVAVVWAAGLQRASTNSRSKALQLGVLVGVALLFWVNGISIAQTTAYEAEKSRQARVPFRDIMRMQPAPADDTKFFLVEPPVMTMRDLAGLFLLQYGSKVSVGGTFEDGRPWAQGQMRNERADLRNHAAAFVYYFDETRRPVQVPVDHDAAVSAESTSPVDFEEPIQLEGYEVSSTKVSPGEDLIVILYWRATGSIQKDYTVFVHLVDGNGRMVEGADSMPRDGKERTGTWKAGRFTSDAHILRIPQDAAPGNDYRMEIGLYSIATLERVRLVDGDGLVANDAVVIEPLQVVR